MPTEMELTLEQTQQGVSYEVSVNPHRFKGIFKDGDGEHAELDESDTHVLERFDTPAGNPVKKILLKLNLSDYVQGRTHGYEGIFKDGDGGCLAKLWSFTPSTETTHIHHRLIKMAMRDLVTGRENFDPSASSSDPLGALANALIGSSSQKLVKLLLNFVMILSSSDKTELLMRIRILEHLIHAYNISPDVLDTNKLLKNRGGKLSMLGRKVRLAQIRA
ncbi:hypothetical protein Tco_0332037 [Tanacetum coccineum]